MVITRFNRFVAKHGRVAFIIIGLVIVIPFVFFFGPGEGGADQQGYSGPVAKLYGQKIDRETFMHHMQAVDIDAILQYGRGFSSDERFQSFWMDETLKRLVGLETARQRGLDAVTNEQVVDYVRGLDQFRNDEGAFDKETFTRFMQNIKQARDISGAEFDRMIRESVILDRFEAVVGAGVFVSDEEVEAAARRGETKVDLKYRQFTADDAMSEVSLIPDDPTIQDYFDEFGDTIKLPAKKKILVAEFKLENFTVDDDAVSREDVEKYYEERKQFFQRMDREAAYERIRDLLRSGRKREKARAKAEALREAAMERMDDAEDGLSAPAALRAAAEELGDEVSAVKESGWFSPDMPIPNVGQRPSLAKTGYDLSKEQPLSNVVYDGNAFNVACLLDTKPVETPEELTEEVREIIAETLVDRKIESYYRDHVEPYREAIEEGLTPDDLIQEKQMQLNMRSDLSEEEIEKRLADYRDTVETHLKPYYKPPQRKVLLTAFRTDDFRSKVSVSDEEAKTLLTEKAERLAKEQAYEFADRAYQAVLDRDASTSPAEVFSKIASERGLEPAETGWFGPQGRISGFERESGLASKAHKATRENPVSEVIEGQQGIYVACWKDTQEGALPVIDDNPQLKNQVRRRIKKERALEVAREIGRSLHQEVSAKLDEGVPFSETVPEDASFESIDPFKPAGGPPPRGLPQAQAVVAALSGASSNTMLEPLETENGLLLVYLADRIAPTEEELKEVLDMYRSRLRNRKQQELLANTYEKLQDDANLELMGPWAEQR